MSWWQLTVECARDELAQIEDTLLALGAISLTISDAQDEPIYEPLPGETPLWSRSRITGLFDQSRSLEDLHDDLARNLPDYLARSIDRQQLEDEPWERAFLDRYQPIRFGRRLWVCPGWRQPPAPDACNIILDPGIAFGTGSHPTTALCLEHLDSEPPVNHSVIDYGCGSGILAIAALKLGAQAVIAVDIDAQALQATRDNAKRNHIEPQQLRVVSPEQIPERPVDCLLANILSGPLIDLEPRFAGLCKPGARLLLSGILAEQASPVRAAYSAHFIIDTVTMRDGWCRITGTRNHHA